MKFIMSYFKKFYVILFSFVIFISIFFVPVISRTQLNNMVSSIKLNPEIIEADSNRFGFIWPIPGYTTVSSPYGKRNTPTSGASSFHYGTDIPAPEGTKLIALHDGKITFCSFLGPGGYTITISFDNFKVSYCHVSPDFIVKIGDFVKQGQVIGNVGPKYVYGVNGNIYSDVTGKPTNGATTRLSFTFTVLELMIIIQIH